jgi:bacteriocin-like protein
MANDTEKLPKPETAKPKEIGRQDRVPRDKELTDEQLRNITGGGGEPPVVVDRT